MRIAPTKLAYCLLFASLPLIAGEPARAWKPTMHAFLADVALQDAVDDGRITVNRVNFQTGQVQGPVGTYAVDPEILQALRRFPDHYRAGVVGPDAYPDILTGQQCIHTDAPLGGPGGTNAWLEYIWARSQLPSLTGDKRLKARAFAVGYLTHAAGDMYAHTFVNHFAGGDFSIGPNGVRHFVMEGYMGKRCPDPAFGISVSGIEDWIYDTLVDSRKGTFLAQRLLVGNRRVLSIPFLYSRLRDKLVADVDFYYRHKDDIGTRVGSFAQTKYKEAWIKDIDAGLRRWVTVSHELNKALLFNNDLGGESLSRAKEIMGEYVRLHILSMSGAPDFVGLTLNAIHQIVDAVMDAIFPEFIQKFFEEVKEDILNFILKRTVGMTLDQIKTLLRNPELHFDRVMFQANESPNKLTLAQMNRDHLKISDPGFQNPAEKFRVESFAPAYNTMVLSKLIYLPQGEVNRLIADLTAGLGPAVRPGGGLAIFSRGLSDRGFLEQKLLRSKIAAIMAADAQKEAEESAPPGKLQSIVGQIKAPVFELVQTPSSGITLNASNIMLGFNRKIDGSNQWHVNPAKMILVHAGVYDQVFMKFAGDTTPQSAAPTPPPPPEDPFATVRVVINRVAQISKSIDPPFNGNADFYTKVTIDGEKFETDDIANTRTIQPNWTFTKQVQRAQSFCTIRIEIWDEDSNGRGDDDQCDVNPGPGKTLVLRYDIRGRRFTGAASGTSGAPVTVRGTESDSAELTFTITGN